MATPPIVRPPEDLTGRSLLNLVKNEERVVVSNVARLFVPSSGPFFSSTMRIFNKKNNVELRPVTDFKCLHLQNAATIDSGQQVCCMVIILNVNITDIQLTYQAVGGDYDQYVSTLRQSVTGAVWKNVVGYAWASNVFGVLDLTPGAPHLTPPESFTDWMRTVQALQNIYQALIVKDAAAWESIYNYIGRQITSGFTGRYTDSEMDDKFLELGKLLNERAILSGRPKNLLRLNPDGVYFNDMYRLKTVTSSYMIQDDDIGSRTIVRMNTATAATCTVPTVGSSIAVGSTVLIRRVRGEVTVQGGTGVTLTPSVGNKVDLELPGVVVKLVYTGSDSWDAVLTGVFDKPLPVPPPVTTTPPPVVVPPTPPVSPYDIMEGYAFNIASTIDVTPQVGSTVTFVAVNKDYRNRPVKFQVNWSLRNYTKVDGDTGVSSGNIYVDGSTDANGRVTISATLPDYDKLPKQWQAGTHMYLTYDIAATEPMNPPYPPKVMNSVFFSMAGLVDLKANTQISERGRVSYVHYNGRLNLPKAPIDTVTPVSQLHINFYSTNVRYDESKITMNTGVVHTKKSGWVFPNAIREQKQVSSFDVQSAWFTNPPALWDNGNYINVTMTMPTEFDPVKHRVEVAGVPITITGRTIKIALVLRRFDYKVGKRTWHTWDMNHNASITIYNKPG